MEWLNKEWTPARLNALAGVTAERGGRLAMRERFGEIDPTAQAWVLETVLNGRVPLVASSAWIVPVLSPEAADFLLEETQFLDWFPNEEEEQAYQIPEIILSEQAPYLDQLVKDALWRGLAPWIAAIYGRLPARYASVQMTQYHEDATHEGHFHIDQDSDYSAVIALNNDFTGGGTTIVDGLFGEFSIPPLPPGYALLFDGRRVFHKGNSVTSGTRHLLTVWANNDEDLF